MTTRGQALAALLAPDGAVMIWPGSRPGPREVLSTLPRGAPVVICHNRALRRRRAARAARRSRVRLDRHYLAVPSLDSAQVMVEDRPAVLRYFFERFAGLPPNTQRHRRILSAALRIAARSPAARHVACTVFGSVTVGHRT
jgi:hypothetical protein